MRIAICAGHHPDAKGAVNKKHHINEHDEAEKVLVHLARMLINQGHQVHSFYGKLKNKVAGINAGNFDVALDIHFNADYDHLDPDDLDSGRGHGSMVMFCPQVDRYGKPEPESVRRKQADAFSFSMGSFIGERDLKGRPGWYWGSNPPTAKDYFLRETNCAAFIPEPGYIDNNAFAEKWLVAGRHDQIAEAIVIGLTEAMIAGD